MIRNNVYFEAYFCCQARRLTSKIIEKSLLKLKKCHFVEPLECLIFFEWKSGIRTHDFHSFFAITERVGLCNHVRTSIF